MGRRSRGIIAQTVFSQRSTRAVRSLPSRGRLRSAYLHQALSSETRTPAYVIRSPHFVRDTRGASVPLFEPTFDPRRLREVRFVAVEERRDEDESRPRH